MNGSSESIKAPTSTLKTHQKTYLLVAALLLSLAQFSYGQGFRTQFGKNRIQTKQYDWKFFSQDKFDVYYYLSGRELASFVASEAAYHIDDVESFFDFRLDDKITFVVYNSKLDLRQSNMFLERDAYNIGGTTKIIGNTCFINFSGDHFEFIKNIRAGIGQVIINEMLYGGSIQERLQNSTLLHLPDWYTNGLVNHIAYGWDFERDSRLRNGMLSGDIRRMASLPTLDKELVSQAIWMYIEKRYGSESLSNVLYVSRVNKSMESGYMYVLGKSLAELYDEWYDYTYYQYVDDEARAAIFSRSRDLPRRFTRKKVISEFAFNHDSTLMAIATNREGKVRLHTYDVATGKRKRVMSFGYKNAENELDLSYPVFTWDIKQNILHYVFEKDGDPQYIQYDVDLEKVLRKGPLSQIQKVYSLSPSPDGRNFVISGLKNGRVDIMLLDGGAYFVRSLTNDDYDDKDPIFVNDGKGIIFSSNRPDGDFKDIKKFENNFDYEPNFDLFFYDFKGKAKEFVKITHTPGIGELQPHVFRDSLITFLYTTNGVRQLGVLKRKKLFKNLMAVRRMKNNLVTPDDTLYFSSTDEFLSYQESLDDSVMMGISRIDTQSTLKDTSLLYSMTSLGESLLQYQILDDERIVHLSLKNNRYGLFDHLVVDDDVLINPIKLHPGKKGKGRKRVVVDNEESNAEPEPEIKFDYTFQTGFEDLEARKPELDTKPSENKDISIRTNEEETRKQAKYYFLSFSPDQIVTQFDIGNFNTPYLPYRRGDNSVNANGLRGMARVAVSDMFKDYRLEAGARPSVNLLGFDFFARYENLKKRWDKELYYFRTTERSSNDTAVLKEISQSLTGALKYPFSEIASVRFETTVRQDVLNKLSTDRDALSDPANNTYWIGGKVEYVFDNTIKDGTNVHYGLRYKLYYEHFTQFMGDQSLNIIGGDFRHYLKIYKSFIWANRLAFASSLGQQKVVYFLGGTENWLVPQYNTEINVDEEIDYVYKSAAVNLRGFDQNIRNGASYALVNSELRLPVFRFFSNKPLKSSFLENFQAIGFVDAGVAFNGLSPFSEDNAFNKKIYYADPVVIERWSLRKPVVGGYGFGLRSNIMGYFVRLDWAWGVESGIEPEQRFYLSLGTDF